MMFYIAGPMEGYDDNNKAAFDAAEHELQVKGLRVFNPHVVDAMLREEFGRAPEMYEIMLKDLDEIVDSDAVILLDGWEKSTGAHCEKLFADRIGKPIFTKSSGDGFDGMRKVRSWGAVNDTARDMPDVLRLLRGVAMTFADALTEFKNGNPIARHTWQPNIFVVPPLLFPVKHGENKTPQLIGPPPLTVDDMDAEDWYVAEIAGTKEVEMVETKECITA